MLPKEMFKVLSLFTMHYNNFRTIFCKPTFPISFIIFPVTITINHLPFLNSFQVHLNICLHFQAIHALIHHLHHDTILIDQKYCVEAIQMVHIHVKQSNKIY